MMELRIASRLARAMAFTGIQSATAAFGGTVSVPTNTQIVASLEPYAKVEILKALYTSHEAKDPRLTVNITVLLGGPATAAEAILTYPGSTYYMVDALGIGESTFDAFARTVQQTFRALESGRRPPDRPPPPR